MGFATEPMFGAITVVIVRISVCDCSDTILQCGEDCRPCARCVFIPVVDITVAERIGLSEGVNVGLGAMIPYSPKICLYVEIRLGRLLSDSVTFLCALGLPESDGHPFRPK